MNSDKSNIHKEQTKHPNTRSSNSQQIDEDARLAAQLAEENDESPNRDCTSDSALAALLQRQFDIEYNRQIDWEEARRNGQSKVGVSLNKFKRNSSLNHNDSQSIVDDDDNDYDNVNDDCDSSYGRLEDDTDSVCHDVFEQCKLKQRSHMVGRAGFVIDQDGNIITKHDIPTSSRKNMCKLMESKTDIQTGDGGAKKDNFMLTNYVYNRLKDHSKKNSRRASKKEFDKKERDNTIASMSELHSSRLNPATKIIIDSLMASYRIEKMNGVIGHGKESTVFHAVGLDHDGEPNQDIALKIYKSDINIAFKTRDSYNKSKCPSYKFDKPKSKNDSLNKWAEKGYKNLKLLRKANINCPEPILLRKNVLIMSFLGSGSSPSPRLKDVHLSEKQMKESYSQVIDIMYRMYRECDLIHGDLSEYNLLWHKNNLFVIDVSQSMSSTHPMANNFLYRDCENLYEFYKKSGLNEELIMDPKTLFTHVSGKSLDNKNVELWCKIQDFPCNERIMRENEKDLVDMSKEHEGSDNFVQMMKSVNLCNEVHVKE